MIQKKSEKGDLEKKKTTYVLIGMLLVLGLVYSGFELFATRDKDNAIAVMEVDDVIVNDEDVVATDHTPPPPPPPMQQQQEVVLNVVADNIKIDADFNFDVEITENLSIEEYVPIENVEVKVEEAPAVRFAEEMPEPIGGMDAVYKFLSETLQYPEAARVDGRSGTTVVEFVVETDGRISNAKVMMSSDHADLDKEAVRAVSLMKPWKPGKTMGKAIRVFYQIPVKFTLN
jgi:protein TonB